MFRRAGSVPAAPGDDTATSEEGKVADGGGVGGAQTSERPPKDVFSDYVEALLPEMPQGASELPRQMADAVRAGKVPTVADLGSDIGTGLIVLAALLREALLMLGDVFKVVRRRYDDEEKKLGADVLRARVRSGAYGALFLLLLVTAYGFAAAASRAHKPKRPEGPKPPPPPYTGAGTWADSFMFPKLSDELGYDVLRTAGGPRNRRVGPPVEAAKPKPKPAPIRRPPRAEKLPPVGAPLTHKQALTHAKQRGGLPEIGADGNKVGAHHHMAAAGVWPSEQRQATRLQKKFLEGAALQAKALGTPIIHHNLHGGPSFHAHLNDFLNKGMRDGSIVAHDGTAAGRGALTMGGRTRTRMHRNPTATDKTAAAVRRAPTLRQAMRSAPRAHQLHDAVGPILPEGAGGVRFGDQVMHINPQWDTLSSRASRSADPRTMRRRAVPLHAAPHYGGSSKGWHIAPESQTDVKLTRGLRRRAGASALADRTGTRVRNAMAQRGAEAAMDLGSVSRTRKAKID